MNDEQRTVRLVQTWLESEAPGHVPAGLLDRINTTTRSSRPRPVWIARLEGHHMNVIEGGRRTASPRLGLVLAIIGLTLALLGAAAFVGSRQPTKTVVPNSSVSLPSGPPATSAQPGGKLTFRSIQPGDPVPEALIGTWYDAAGDEYAYYLRAGDPYCVKHWKTQQDCQVWYVEGMDGWQPNANIVTVVDGQLRYWSMGNDRCKDQASLATYTVSADALRPTVLPGQCFTGLASLVRVGSGGAPSAAPTLPPF